MVFKNICDSKTFQDGKFLQVLLLSFSFMFLFTAFQTTGIIEETVLQSLRNETSYCQTTTANKTPLILENGECRNGTRESTFTGSGYTSLSILYAVFAFSSWIAPSLVAIIHAKWSMVISSVIYVLFIASFLIPSTWLLYTLSALLGMAAAVLWTGQGQFLSLVSTPETITRNSGVFWAINQCSLFFGNLLVFWQLQGKTEIDATTRSLIFIPLSVVGVIGIFCFCLLKNLKGQTNADPSEVITDKENVTASTIDADDVSTTVTNSNQNGCVHPTTTSQKETTMISTALTALKEVLQLFVTRHMLLLSIACIYSGLEFSFLSGVYSTAVGNTSLLGSDAKKFVGLVGILTGIGEVAGGSLFGLFGARTTKRGRSPIVFLGALVHATCYVLIFLNLPDESTIRETSENAYFSSPLASIALLCAFFLGFGDACLQTQLISIFASVYKEKSAQAFAIFKFTQSAASAAAFYSSSYLGIFVQVVILLVTAIISFAAFLVVELRTKRILKMVEEMESSPKLEGEAHPEEIKI